MVNSRQLAERVALVMGKPATSTAQHIKNLREAKQSSDRIPLVTAGGRGRNAPTMTRKDAATLICAVLGSEAIQDSVETVEWIRNLKPEFHGYRFKSAYFDADIGIRAENDAIEALTKVLEFFDRDNLHRRYLERYRGYAEIFSTFYVEFPQRFISLTFGIRRMVSVSWSYGRRLGVRDKQARWIDQDQLREISEFSGSSATEKSG